MIRGRLYGSGQPDHGREVTVSVQGRQLCLADSDGQVDCVALTADVGGFHHDQLQLSWADDVAGRLTLIPLTLVDQQALVAQLPLADIPTLRRWRRDTTRQRRVWQGVVGGLATLVLAAVLLVWQHDRVLNWVTWQIPRDAEIRLGKQVLAALQDEKVFIKEGASVDAVRRIGSQLTQGTSYPYQWFVVDDDSVNAFALPGGSIVVNAGLLRVAASADELAAVLAHEVQHVERRHALRNMVNQASLAAVMLVVLGDANAIIALVAHQASTQYFSRGMESEADALGVQLLHRRKQPTQPMVSMFEKLKQRSVVPAGAKPPVPTKPKSMPPRKRETDRPLAWLSSHPQVDERILAIKRFILNNPCKICQPLAIDWPTVQRGLEQDIRKVRGTR
ncbi:MAG: M48 family metallopeptidase [Thiobacillus sp.]